MAACLHRTWSSCWCWRQGKANCMYICSTRWRHSNGQWVCHPALPDPEHCAEDHLPWECGPGGEAVGRPGSPKEGCSILGEELVFLDRLREKEELTTVLSAWFLGSLLTQCFVIPNEVSCHNVWQVLLHYNKMRSWSSKNRMQSDTCLSRVCSYAVTAV